MWTWIGAAALGIAVGLAELISRYTDRPSALPKSFSFWLYLTLNGGASVAAFALIRTFNWSFGVSESNPAGREVATVLLAGLAAMALFRSSLLNVKVGTEDVSIGPNLLLTSLLGAADRSVDRRRATQRSEFVAGIMDGVVFDTAKLSLTAYCLQLMQNVSVTDQQKIRTQVDALGLLAIPNELKSLNLGLLLMNSVGEDVLSAAVKSLGDKIKK